MHAHAHAMGRDVDLDVRNGWLIGLAMVASIIVATGVIMLVRDDGAIPIATPSVAQPVTISEQLTAAQDRLAGLRDIGASPALMAPTTTEALLATQAFADQARDTAREIERMLRQVQIPEGPVLSVPR